MGLSVHDPFVDPLGNPLGLAINSAIQGMGNPKYFIVDFLNTSGTVFTQTTVYKKARFTLIGAGGGRLSSGGETTYGRGAQGGGSAVSNIIDINGELDFTYACGTSSTTQSTGTSTLTVRLAGIVIGTLTAPGGGRAGVSHAANPGTGTGIFAAGYSGGFGGAVPPTGSITAGAGGGGAAGPNGPGAPGGIGASNANGYNDNYGGPGASPAEGSGAGAGGGGGRSSGGIAGYGAAGGGIGGSGGIARDAAAPGYSLPFIADQLADPMVVRMTETSPRPYYIGGIGGGGAPGSAGLSVTGGQGILRLELWLK